MYQRDYLLRMIEMIAQLIAGILKLIKTGNLESGIPGIAKCLWCGI